MGNGFTHQIGDNFIDLSQIKTFRLVIWNGQEVNRKQIEILFKDRIIYIDGDKDNREIINDKLDVFFDNEISANKELRELIAAWEEYIATHQGR